MARNMAVDPRERWRDRLSGGKLSPLTALLADGVWEVNATTSTTTGDDASAGPNFQNTTVVVQAFGGSYDPR